MRNWRVLTAIAAVVLAALAGVLVWKYADDAKKDAEAPFQMKSVLVAAKRVPANTSFQSALDGKLIVAESRVARDLPATAVSEDTDTNLKASFKALVSAHDISSDETIVREDFVAQGQVISGLKGQIDSDQSKDKVNQLQALTLTFDDQRAVGGFVQPGDVVNIMFNGKADQDHFLEPPGQNKGVKFTSFLLPGIKVLAVGSTTAAPATTASATTAGDTTPTTLQQLVSRNLITLEVNARQAQQLVQGQAFGTLYMSLNPTSFKAGTFRDPGEVVEAINLFDKPLPQLDKSGQLATQRSKEKF